MSTSRASPGSSTRTARGRPGGRGRRGAEAGRERRRVRQASTLVPPPSWLGTTTGAVATASTRSARSPRPAAGRPPPPAAPTRWSWRPRPRPGRRSGRRPRRLLDHPAAHGVGPPPHLAVGGDHHRPASPRTAWRARPRPRTWRWPAGRRCSGPTSGARRPLASARAFTGTSGTGIAGNGTMRRAWPAAGIHTWPGRRAAGDPLLGPARLPGLLNIPRHGPVIIAANHISYFDPLCLGTFIHTAGRQVRFLAKSELYQQGRWARSCAGPGRSRCTARPATPTRP